jgi:hypothetical protein
MTKTTPRDAAAARYSAACIEFNRAEAGVKTAQERVRQARAACEELEREPPPPVDRTACELSGGKPETDDHREINPATGLQKGYVVLTADERGKGFVRPFRDAYRHLTCGAITTMARDIAETYARDPTFYSGTFCSTCRGHFPVSEDGEFTWYEMDGREGPKVGT